MTGKPDDDTLAALIAAAAATLGIPLDPAWTPAVRTSLETTLTFAALVEEFPLPDEAEPAPVYRA